MSQQKTNPSQRPRMAWVDLTDLTSEPKAMKDSRMSKSINQAITGQTEPDDSVTLHCSLCRHPYKRSETKVPPFCSVRCQQIDLGLWLDEKLGLPIESQEDQEFTGWDDEENV